MRKLLLLLLSLWAFPSQAQIFHLTYNTTICPSPLNGAASIYLYAGANITAPGSSPTFFADAAFTNPGLYPLTQTGPGIWEICFNPYQIFKDGNGSSIPVSATIYSFDLNFRDALTNIFTGQCSDASVVIQNPMTNSSSSHPSIANGSPVTTCNVGINSLNNSLLSIYNSPSPLRTFTTFRINLPVKGVASLAIFNILGEKVYSLMNEQELSGQTDVVWKGEGNSGAFLANGCYFYTLTVDGKTVKTNKIIISR